MKDPLLEGCPPGLGLSPELVDVVRRAYATPGRVYHDIRHVEEVVRRFVEAARDVGWRRPREVYLAVLFHDAVYAPGAKDNEARSAELARNAVVEYVKDASLDCNRMGDLIRLTSAHGKLSPSEVDAEAALFLDCDMAILGADRDVFDAYEDAIALEYAHLPPAVYAAGRGAFLAHLLDGDRIFLSDYGHGRWETFARSNIARALGGAKGPL